MPCVMRFVSIMSNGIPIEIRNVKELKNMTENKHTPGPWRPDIRRADGSITVTSPGTIYIATLWTSHSFAKETDANARLISAAPTLLAWLQWMRANLVTHNSYLDDVTINGLTLDAAIEEAMP